MHGGLQANEALLHGIKSAAVELSAEVVVCVPFPYLAQAQVALAGSLVAWGAQTLSAHELGAYTGEVSGSMLSDFGCRFVLVGHSERRSLYGESDEVVAAKFEAAKRVGVTPILCIGETLAERESGATVEVVVRQLQAVVACVGVSGLASSVLAYEPVWAIGTGVTASPEQAQEVHSQIRRYVAGLDPVVANELRILYGGSVKPGNAKELFGQSDIDGGLIGAAALALGDFLAICRAAD